MDPDGYDLSGRIAIVTGGGTGIGAATSRLLARHGADVVIASRTESELERMAGSIREATGRRCLAVPTDVKDEQQVIRLVQRTVDEFGRIDILINNAGIYPMQSFDEITFEDWRRVFSVNLDSMFLMTKAFAAGMRQRRWGRIVNIASDTVSLVVPGFTHYIASKAGVIGLTRALATELGDNGITANAIAPGLTRTPGTLARKEIPGGMSNDAFFDLIANMQSIKRGELVSDLVGAVSFLASDEAAFITGQTLYVNGGLTRT